MKIKWRGKDHGKVENAKLKGKSADGRVVRESGLKLVALSEGSPMYEYELEIALHTMVRLGPNLFRTCSRRELTRRRKGTQERKCAAKIGLSRHRRGEVAPTTAGTRRRKQARRIASVG